MHNIVGVTIVHRRQHLFHDLRRFLLSEILPDLKFLYDLVEELSSFQVIHYNQEGVSVFEEFVYFNDGRMILDKCYEVVF